MASVEKKSVNVDAFTGRSVADEAAYVRVVSTVKRNSPWGMKLLRRKLH